MATADQIAELRGMIAEPTNALFSDAQLATHINKRAIPDEWGRPPTLGRIADGTLRTNPDWVQTYDLNGVASELWAVKAGKVAAAYSFTADGASHQRSDLYAHALQQARYYRSLRAVGMVHVLPMNHAASEE